MLACQYKWDKYTFSESDYRVNISPLALTEVSSPFSEFSVRSRDLRDVGTNLLLVKASASLLTPLAVIPVWARFR